MVADAILDHPISALKNVTRLYTEGHVTALRDVSLEITPGELLIIVGPSGSGKSTLLHMLGGLDRPTTGHVYFEGTLPKSASDWAHIRATRIGFVFQSFNLLPNYSAAENVEVPMLGVERDATIRRERTEWLLERVGLADRMTHRPKELSAGQQQRVAIARSLANSPDVVLADEPTGNLDSKSSSEVFQLLKDVNTEQGTSLVIVTHDLRLPDQGTRVVEMIDGKIVLD